MGSYSRRKTPLCKRGRRERSKMSAQTKVEVTRGVFDPRTYKQVDKQNWARKRKPEWMATTGQIHFVRERTVASQERELEEERRAQAAQDEASQELKAEVQEDPAPAPVKVEIAPIHRPQEVFLRSLQLQATSATLPPCDLRRQSDTSCHVLAVFCLVEVLYPVIYAVNYH